MRGTIHPRTRDEKGTLVRGFLVSKKQAGSSGAKLLFIKINTPEKLILKRLRKKKYAAKELFKNADEAIRVYFIREKLRKNLRGRNLKIRPDFVINNARPIGPQIKQIIKGL